MDPFYALINHTTYNVDACLVDCVTTRTILHDKKYFSNLTLVKSNVNTISGYVNLIQGFRRATSILPSETIIYINDALYYVDSSQNLLSIKNNCWNGYHIKTKNNGSNEYLFITLIIFRKKYILEKLHSYSCRLY